MDQLLLQLVKGAVVDVDGAVELSAFGGALLRDLSAEAGVELHPLRFGELDPVFFPNT